MTLIITGGTKGIGLGVARRLARPGLPMVLVYRSDRDAAASAAAELTSAGARVTTIQADVGEIDGAARVIEAAAGLGGATLQLVHSAAMIYPTSLLDADLGRFTQAVQTNGLSLLYLVQKARPLLEPGSAIVFISRAGARTASPNYAALGVGKALAESLIRYLVPELAPLGARINAVAPGLVETGSVAGMVGSEEAAQRLYERAARANPSGRISRHEDYAAMVEYLLSPAAEFVQGQVIHVNGGAYVPG